MPRFKSTIKALPKPEIIHIHGIWQYCYHQIVSYARRNSIPYILTPRGTLYPQALAKSKLKKKLSRMVYQDKDLECANCVIVTCEEELKHYRDLGFKNPVAIIPNPIDVDNIVGPDIPIKYKKKIGYLGRLHPRKHVERLIQAFQDLGPVVSDMELIIIGGGSEEYERYLKDMVSTAQIHNITFAGFLKGPEKDKAIRDLSLVALPSDFENFGNVISEALVRGVPVLTTKGAPWQIVEEYKCGWWVENSQANINSAIMHFANLIPSEIREMGLRGIQMISEKFSVDKVAAKNNQLYEWILGRSIKPEFVQLGK